MYIPFVIKKKKDNITLKKAKIQERTMRPSILKDFCLDEISYSKDAIDY